MKTQFAYLTYNDAPSGIYSSQVIDVVKFIESNLDFEIKLIAFISIRNYWHNRKKIKKELSTAIVLPMFPKTTNWAKNIFLLSIICNYYSINNIIGRSVLATQLALKLKRNGTLKKVIYDGRGAIAAEWNEYNVINNKTLLNKIERWEQDVVLNSDYRIAVSNNLVDYWKVKYKYTNKEHVIVPCTINKVFELINFDAENIRNTRKKLNFSDKDIVFIYSGSLAGWQSFNYLNTFFQELLSESKNNKVLFLSDEDKNITNLQFEFPNQVFNKKVLPAEVPNYLIAGDYGILLRKESITNKVASPVKFAEYLSCGLKVIISRNLGDYSQLIKENDSLGYIENNYQNIYHHISFNQKHIIRNYALNKYTKACFKSSYKTFLS